MSKFEGHAPAPWKVLPGPQLVDANGKDLLGSWRWTEHVDCRLLAAAPDLLAENERLRTALEIVGSHYCKNVCPKDSPNHTLLCRQAQAALGVKS